MLGKLMTAALVSLTLVMALQAQGPEAAPAAGADKADKADKPAVKPMRTAATAPATRPIEQVLPADFLGFAGEVMGKVVKLHGIGQGVVIHVTKIGAMDEKANKAKDPMAIVGKDLVILAAFEKKANAQTASVNGAQMSALKQLKVGQEVTLSVINDKAHAVHLTAVPATQKAPSTQPRAGKAPAISAEPVKAADKAGEKPQPKPEKSAEAIRK